MGYYCNRYWMALLIVYCCLCADLIARKRKRVVVQDSLLEQVDTCEQQEIIQEENHEQHEQQEAVQEEGGQQELEAEVSITVPEEKEKHHIVRVLLQAWSVSYNRSVQLGSSSGIWLLDPENRSTRLSYDVSTVSIGTVDGALSFNGKKVARDHFYLIPKEGCIIYGNNRYQGVILVVNDKTNILLINCVELEDYIFSVLHTESWPGWPLEVNKVFAVASRSYVIAMMQQDSKKNSFYHVYNTNFHQTYTGFHTQEILREATEQTRGQFLTHHDKPVIAMFDSCCGGIVPAHIADFDFEKAPYLARTYSCNHCKLCNIYRWKVVYKFAQLEQILKDAIPDISNLKNIHISKKDKAGLVQTIEIEPGSYIISGKKLYSLLKGIKSFCFTIERNRNTFIFSGKGFGHHIGLCQWGAREMVRDGRDYKRILHFYYPGTKLARIT